MDSESPSTLFFSNENETEPVSNDGCTIVLAVDASRGTRNNEKYWCEVRRLYNKLRPSRVFLWNTKVEEVSIVREESVGAAAPYQLFSRLTTVLDPNKKHKLVITSNGQEMEPAHIEECRKPWPSLEKTIAHISVSYCGYASQAICFDLHSAISTLFRALDDQVDLPTPFHSNNNEPMTLERFLNPTFAVRTTVRAEMMKDDVFRMATLRREVLGDCDYLLKKASAKEKDLLHCKSTNDTATAFQLASDPINITSFVRRRRALELVCMAETQRPLSFFIDDDGYLVFNELCYIEHFLLPDDFLKRRHGFFRTYSNFEVEIDSSILEHPFKILGNAALVAAITTTISVNWETNLKNFLANEPFHLIYVGSIQHNGLTTQEETSTIISPMKTIWNLLFAFLIWKRMCEQPHASPRNMLTRAGTHQSQGTYGCAKITQKAIMDFCSKHKVPILFSLQTPKVRREVSVEFAFWFSLFVTTQECPNTECNVLRSPFGSELYSFYHDMFDKTFEKYKKIPKSLDRVARKWMAWTYIVENWESPGFDQEIRAQYEEHIVCKSGLLFVDFPVPEPQYRPPSVLSKQWVKWFHGKAKEEASMYLDLEPTCVYHLRLNPRTCWPFVVCPVTNKDSTECLGPHIEHFNAFIVYCEFHKQFPPSSEELALFFSNIKSIERVSVETLEIFQLIFEGYVCIMKQYTCKSYVENYRAQDKAKRLESEQEYILTM